MQLAMSKTWSGCNTRPEDCFSSGTKKGFCSEGSEEDCYSTDMAGNCSTGAGIDCNSITGS